MNNTGDLTIKETWDYINKIKETQAEKWMQKYNKIIEEKKEFENEYYRIIEERSINDSIKSNLLESYKNDLLGRALKAVYITALEAESLSDNGIILAEDMVNNYIKEQGGASKIMSKNSGKTYFLDMLFNKINETANEQLENFISGKYETTNIEVEEDKEEIKTEKVSFLRGLGESDRSYTNIFTRSLLEEDDNSDDNINKDDDSDLDADVDLGGDADIEDDKEDDNSKKDESNDIENDESEDDNLDNDEDGEEDSDNDNSDSEEKVDSSDTDLGGDADIEDDREVPENNSEEDDEIILDDDDSEEKDLRDDLSSDEKEETDPSEKTEDEFLNDLDKEEDVKKAVELIRARVANAEEEFIKRNAEDKKKINDLLGKISDNVKVVKDISVNDTDKSVGDEVVTNDNETSTEESTTVKIAKERIGAYNRLINDIRENKPFTIYEKFTRNLSNNIMKNESVRESYMIDGEIDFYNIMESCKVMYAWLETVNTLQLEKVDSEYIRKVLDNIH